VLAVAAAVSVDVVEMIIAFPWPLCFFIIVFLLF